MNPQCTTEPAKAPAPIRKMGKTTVWLDGRDLLAALIFASDDATRFHLNGVCLHVAFGEPRPVRLFATDGRRAIAIRSLPCGDDQQARYEPDADELIPAESDTALLPPELIKRMKALLSKSEPNVQIEIEPGAAHGQRRVIVTSPVSRRGVVGWTQDAIFPLAGLGAVFVQSNAVAIGGRREAGEPVTAPVPPSQFLVAVNAVYLHDCARVAQIFGDSSEIIHIYRAGDADAPMHVHLPGADLPEVEILIMSARDTNAPDWWERPSWLPVASQQKLDLPDAET
jgi:hypothetical protein